MGRWTRYLLSIRVPRGDPQGPARAVWRGSRPGCFPRKTKRSRAAILAARLIARHQSLGPGQPPEADRPVEAARQRALAVRRERHAVNQLLVAAEPAHLLARLNVPQPHRLV